MRSNIPVTQKEYLLNEKTTLLSTPADLAKIN